MVTNNKIRLVCGVVSVEVCGEFNINQENIKHYKKLLFELLDAYHGSNPRIRREPLNKEGFEE